MNLHSIVLKLEKESFALNNHFSIGFIGGSCKLCKEGCPPKCTHPDLARIPVEPGTPKGLDAAESERSSEDFLRSVS